jgi:hypothetical protein
MIELEKRLAIRRLEDAKQLLFWDLPMTTPKTDRIEQVTSGFMASTVLFSAIEFGLFTELAKPRWTPRKFKDGADFIRAGFTISSTRWWRSE